MNGIKLWLIYTAHTMLRFVCPLVVPIALITSIGNKSKHPTYKKTVLVNARLRAIWWWLETPDDLFSPYGMYEPTVYKVYDKLGKFFGDWYWLGIRNQAQAFLWYFGKPVPKRFREMTEEEKIQYRVWEKRFTCGKIVFIAGWEHAHNKYRLYMKELGYWTPYWAIPRVTIKFKEG